MHKTEFNALMASNRIASRMGVDLPRIPDRFSRTMSHVRSSQANIQPMPEPVVPMPLYEKIIIGIGLAFIAGWLVWQAARGFV